MNDVVQLLRETGPCLSSELQALLIDRHGLSPAAARKRISREQTAIKRLAFLPFPRNVRFLYLQSQYGSRWFWQALEAALLDTSPAYAGAIASLEQRGGLMPRSHFLIACGAPLRQLKHPSPQMILSRLTQAKLFEEIDVEGVGSCVARAQEDKYYNDLIPPMRARLLVEDIMLKAVRDWARNLGIVSYNATKIRDEEEKPPQVGSFAWDLSAPSYLGGLLDRLPSGKPKPGFLACDLLLDHEITKSGIAPFLLKCRTLRSLPKIGRCIQVFVADSYSNEAFGLAKTHGIIPATSASLFGEEVASSLRQLSSVLQQAAGIHDPQVFDQLFNGLSRIEGAATNLRGALFEFWAAEVVRQLFGATIRINHVVSDGQNKAEIDVEAVCGAREVRFYECKGYKPGGLVADTDVDRWLTSRIPLIFKQAKEHPDWKAHKFHFEFWTTGRLSTAAIAHIKKIQRTVRATRHTLGYCDADAVLATARKTNNKPLIDALRQHFLGHALAKIERGAGRSERKVARPMVTEDDDDL